jgi:hypothetical protein
MNMVLQNKKSLSWSKGSISLGKHVCDVVPMAQQDMTAYESFSSFCQVEITGCPILLRYRLHDIRSWYLKEGITASTNEAN